MYEVWLLREKGTRKKYRVTCKLLLEDQNTNMISSYRRHTHPCANLHLQRPKKNDGEKWVTHLSPWDHLHSHLSHSPLCQFASAKTEKNKDFYKAAFRSNNLHNLLSSFRHDARLERNQFVFTMIICNMISLCGWLKVKVKHQWENKQGIVCMI
jgi:hypothetical protein